MFKGLLRKRRLKKDGSAIQTAFIPLDEIHSMAVVVDMGTPDFQECVSDIEHFCAGHKISLSVLYVDFRPSDRQIIRKDDGDTLFKSDLNCYGKPSSKKVGTFTQTPTDLFVCFANSDDFYVRYLASCTKAGFKIGRRAYEGDPYNFIVTPAADAESAASDNTRILFSVITDFLSKIK